MCTRWCLAGPSGHLERVRCSTLSGGSQQLYQHNAGYEGYVQMRWIVTGLHVQHFHQFLCTTLSQIYSQFPD